MANIEFIQGQESHSSNWGKYYVKGLEKWECKEDGNYDKHQSYSEFQCNDVPEGTVFTIFEQSGNKRGTDVFHFQIFVTTDAEVSTDDSAYGQGKTAGNFKKLAHGDGKVKAPRLMNWWTEQKPKDVDPMAFAEHCQAYIDKRGVKNVPPMEVKPIAEPAPEEVIHHKIMEPIILKGSDYSYSVKITGCSTTFYSISVTNIEIGAIWQDEEDLSWTANLVNDPEQKNLVQGFAHELYAANYLEGHAAREGLLNGTDRVFTMTI